MATQIDGQPGGGSYIPGLTTFGADDILDGFDFDNTFVSGGANDQINTGAGGAMVNLGNFDGVTDTVNLGGAFNHVTTDTVTGMVGSTLTVQGGTGENIVTLKNTGPAANNNVMLGGFHNTINIPKDPTNILSTGAGYGKVTAGTMGDGNSGSTSVVDGGQNNTVIGGDQNFTISGGQGSDGINIGNGTNVITEAGLHDVITVGTGHNTITDLGGNATISFTGSMTGNSGTGAHITESVTLGGGNNSVTEQTPPSTSDRDFTISVNGSSGSNTFNLGNGTNVLSDQGANDSITMGTPNDPSSGGDTVDANGDHDGISLGNGNNSVTANGSHDVIGLGNGNNTVQANGNADNITAGNGNNSITAGGNGDTIGLGTGNNTVLATGNTDTITSAGGKGTFTLGTANMTGTDTLSLTGSTAGTTVDSQGTGNTINLSGQADANITDEVLGGGLKININSLAGVVKVSGFFGDAQGLITLTGFGYASNAASDVHPVSDGSGGILINLTGGGSLDLLGTGSYNPSQFAVS